MFDVRCLNLAAATPVAYPSLVDVVFCSYENQTGFEGGRVDRRACSDLGWLLLLADDHSAFL